MKNPRKFVHGALKTKQNRMVLSKIVTRGGKFASRSSKMSSRGGGKAWGVLEECLESAWRVLGGA